MAVSVTLSKIVYKPDGRIEVYFGGECMYFSSVDELAQFGLDLSDRPDVAHKLLVRWWLARNPDASNPNLVTGKTLTFDLAAPQPIRVQ